jgi:23S rRNA (cytidine1920-2'-O)/16S rRNA (cytidine1409-2'-O)-methyltransferase
MTSRIRADRLLVERRLFESRAKAQAAIAAGLVTADGAVVRKPSDEIAADAALAAQPAHPWVSRGGVKLAAALDHFHLDPKDRICLDVGASTGGFADVLIARGARHVYCVDVGRGQLHPRLRKRPDVTSFEATDVRSLTAAQLTAPPSFVVIDVSFISLKLAIPSASALARPPAELVALIKPQFEAGPGETKKGVVRDARIHEAVCRDLPSFVAGLGWTVHGVIPSPILGGDGNREFLLAARRD